MVMVVLVGLVALMLGAETVGWMQEVLHDTRGLVKSGTATAPPTPL